jgi:photosystem II stability/assembly factor-like uncharacterized protein
MAWVSCQTGMMVNWLRTTDGGHHFTRWWETFGTGGNAFDPLSATVAYRYTGIGPGTPNTFERTTDGGATFTTVARVDFDVESLDFVDPRHGYVLGWDNREGKVDSAHVSLLYSPDGGRDWQVVVVNGPISSGAQTSATEDSLWRGHF